MLLQRSKLNGEVFRELETRRTLRFELSGKAIFLNGKGTTLKEIIKSTLIADARFGRRQRVARYSSPEWCWRWYNEGHWVWRKGLNPLTRASFIITEDLTPTISLEDYCADWAVNPPDIRVKRMLIARVATMVRKMHTAGINHRDCYICHFCFICHLLAGKMN